MLDSGLSLSLTGMEHASPHLIRFGLFELDLRSGELLKRGRKIRLEGQPVQVLICLLESPGELVTREELHRKLWTADTFVNFEHGLNAAVKRLRQALDDSADNSRFVETLPRRGYRFIAPVQAVAVAENMSGAELAAAVAEASLNRDLPEAKDHNEADPSANTAVFVRQRRSRAWRISGLGLLMLESLQSGYFAQGATRRPWFDLW